MTRERSARLLLVMATVVVGSRLGADQALFRSGVSLVRLQVLVLADDKPVSGLTAADFEVSDNGVRQEIASLFAQSEPLDVLLAVDRSATMTGGPIERLKEAASAMVEGLPQTDRCGLLSFSHTISLDVPLGAPRANTIAALQRLRAEGLTSLLDAMYASLGLVENADRRVLILVLSDGRDNRSWTTLARVRALARQSHAMIATAAFVPSHGELRDATEIPNPDLPLLKALASDTGGEVVVATRADGFLAAFRRLIERARSRYVLTYYPKGVASSGWHDVTVKVKSRRVEIVVRRGYDVPAARPSDGFSSRQ